MCGHQKPFLQIRSFVRAGETEELSYIVGKKTEDYPGGLKFEFSAFKTKMDLSAEVKKLANSSLQT